MVTASQLDQALIQDFFDRRVIFVEGDFEEDMSNQIHRSLLALKLTIDSLVGQTPEGYNRPLEYSDLDVTLHISSFGGSAHELFRLVDLINSLKFKVNTIASGKAMSAGAFLLLSGTGTRSATENCSIMMHGIQSVSGGSLDQIVDELKETKRMQAALKRMVARKCKLDKKTVNDLFEKDNFLTAAQAKKLGIIDIVVKNQNARPVKKSKKLTKLAPLEITEVDENARNSDNNDN